MQKIIRVVSLFISAICLMAGCKSISSKQGKNNDYFMGTILYDVEIYHKEDSQNVKNKIAFFGNEMHLTIFENGDIQRLYNGTSSNGYDLHYLDLEQNIVLEKYKASDSLFTHSAAEQNVVKLSDLRLNKSEETQVLNHTLKTVGIGAEQVTENNSKKHLTMKYWYSDQLKIDPSKYANVNDELWGYFIGKTNGSLFLKYEIDYFSYKITYTAKQIQPNIYERQEEKLKTSAPRVSE